MFVSTAFWFSIRIYSFSLMQILKSIQERDICFFFINLLLIIFMHVEIHIEVEVLSLEHHCLLLHNATLKHEMNSDSTCAETAPTGKLMFTYKLKQLAILNFW